MNRDEEKGMDREGDRQRETEGEMNRGLKKLDGLC